MSSFNSSSISILHQHSYGVLGCDFFLLFSLLFFASCNWLFFFFLFFFYLPFLIFRVWLIMTSMSGVRIGTLNVCDNVGCFLFLFYFYFIFKWHISDLPNVRRWLWLIWITVFLTSAYPWGGFRSCLSCLIYHTNNFNLINWLHPKGFLSDPGKSEFSISINACYV